MERFYQLHLGDCFIVDAETFLNTNWDEDKFNFIKCNYYPRLWWKFWQPKVLKNVEIMYMGEKSYDQNQNSFGN